MRGAWGLAWLRIRRHPVSTGILVLCLGLTRIDDKAMPHLGTLTDLETLALSGTAITDVGLLELGKLTKLQTLTLNSARVTKTGVEKLQKALPDCTIYW